MPTLNANWAERLECGSVRAEQDGEKPLLSPEVEEIVKKASEKVRQLREAEEE